MPELASLRVLARVWLPAAAMAALASLAVPAQARDAAAALAADKACLGCHDVNRRKVGPSFRAVAERYATQAGARDMLAVKIRHGSKGAWGVVAMPSNPSLTTEEAQRLADWVMRQR